MAQAVLPAYIAALPAQQQAQAFALLPGNGYFGSSFYSITAADYAALQAGMVLYGFTPAKSVYAHNHSVGYYKHYPAAVYSLSLINGFWSANRGASMAQINSYLAAYNQNEKNAANRSFNVGAITAIAMFVGAGVAGAAAGAGTAAASAPATVSSTAATIAPTVDASLPGLTQAEITQAVTAQAAQDAAATAAGLAPLTQAQLAGYAAQNAGSSLIGTLGSTAATTAESVATGKVVSGIGNLITPAKVSAPAGTTTQIAPAPSTSMLPVLLVVAGLLAKFFIFT
jgi:hypothetical protein